MKKVVLYINQFFGQIGGEEKADIAPQVIEGFVGPAILLNQLLEQAEVTHTILCGDNYMGSHQEEALHTILAELAKLDFDYFVAGPAFQAGRYGNACGAVCLAVKEQFHVPVVTSMHEENPGVDLYREKLLIFRGGKSAASMKQDMKRIAQYIEDCMAGKELLWAEAAHYFPTGKRQEVWLKDQKTAAERGVDMMLQKLRGEPFQTELPIPKADRVPIAPAVKDMKTATIAVVTSGGIVPVDNPDRIQSASATRWGKYDISKMDYLEAGVFKTIHAGFDPAVANANPNVIVPLDALRQMEKEGRFGQLHPYFYTTVGTGTTQAEAARMGREISQCLVEGHVDAVLLVST